MRHLTFYLRYAAQNLWRSGHWTVFAAFCIAAGVATVVALRSLGLAIGDSLIANIREVNHGDITIARTSNSPLSFTVNQGELEELIFTPQEVDSVTNFIQDHGGQVTAYAVYNNVQITRMSASGLGRPQLVTSFFIDLATFPPTHDIRALDPAGQPLRELLTGPYQIVISRNLADDQGIAVGDQVRVTGSEEPFTVKGIVATDAEANVNNLASVFFGFAYFDIRYAEDLQVNPLPNKMSITLPPGTSVEEVERFTWEELRPTIPGRLRVSTTFHLLSRNTEIADMIGRFIVVLGLGALLIGGVGIINTMLVTVGRRTMEIAALKTFGLKVRQIAALFAAEAFLLGVIGSLAGVVIGILLSIVVNRYGEALLQQRLAWRFQPEAAAFGIGLGMVVTMVFGLLPVLMATGVRPAIVLRPNETHLARAGLLHSLIALAVVIVVLGIITGQIIGPVFLQISSRLPNPNLTGIIGVTLALIVLGILTGVLWGVVWLLSHFPAFGVVDLRLALRNMTARRVRTATTLLALATGMFALSSITFFGLGAREIVQFQFSETLGGNVIAVPLIRSEVGQALVDLIVRFEDRITYNTRLSVDSTLLRAVNGQRLQLQDADGIVRDEVRMALVARDSNNPNLRSGTLLEGRDLVPEDRGKRVVVLSSQSALEEALFEYTLEDLGITVGSTVTLMVNRQPVEFEVVGIVGGSNGLVPNFGGVFIPPDSLGIATDYELNILQVEPEHLDEVLAGLSSIPVVMALDATFIDGLLSRLIDQMAAIPTVVGLLSLLAAGVSMANTVSLATLERRRQIGVLKALGLNRRRILRVMLLENTFIGLLGGLLGIGVSALGVALMTNLGTGSTLPIPRDATPIAIALIVASLLIAWVSTFLSARFAVGERVSNVLRYE
jgi:ABC-type antimicrobial peptide transport system permease subunit